MPRNVEYTLKERVEELIDEVKDLRKEIEAVTSFIPDIEENTKVRKNTVYAIVGTFFTVLAAVGYWIVQSTGIIHMPK